LHHWIACDPNTTRYTISIDVRNSAEVNLEIKCSDLQLRNRIESLEVQKKIVKSSPNPVY